MKRVLTIIMLILPFLWSCDKGYEARFSNLYTETMDSVIVGASGAVFSNIAFNQVTAYQKVRTGVHSIVFVTHSGERFYSNMFVPHSGTGKYTIQIDGVRQVSILEDN